MLIVAFKIVRSKRREMYICFQTFTKFMSDDHHSRVNLDFYQTLDIRCVRIPKYPLGQSNLFASVQNCSKCTIRHVYDSARGAGSAWAVGLTQQYCTDWLVGHFCAGQVWPARGLGKVGQGRKEMEWDRGGQKEGIPMGGPAWGGWWNEIPNPHPSWAPSGPLGLVPVTLLVQI